MSSLVEILIVDKVHSCKNLYKVHETEVEYLSKSVTALKSLGKVLCTGVVYLLIIINNHCHSNFVGIFVSFKSANTE